MQASPGVSFHFSLFCTILFNRLLTSTHAAKRRVERMPHRQESHHSSAAVAAAGTSSFIALAYLRPQLFQVPAPWPGHSSMSCLSPICVPAYPCILLPGLAARCPTVCSCRPAHHAAVLFAPTLPVLLALRVLGLLDSRLESEQGRNIFDSERWTCSS